MAVLLKTHKNELFGLIKEWNFDPDDFKWTTIVVNEHLSFRGSHYFFAVSHGKKWTINFSPGERSPEDTQHFDYFEWEEIKSYFKYWLNALNHELDEDDFWANTGKHLLIKASAEKIKNNEIFSVKEQKQISKALKDIKKYLISNHEFNKEQLVLLSEKFEMLERESKTLGKQPWIHTLLGVLFGVAANAAFNPIQAHDLFNFAYNCLKPVLEAPLLLK